MPGAARTAVIDLGQVVDAIMIGAGGTIQFFNLTLQNPAPRNVLRTDTHARYKIKTFGPWPSITVLPNATVSPAGRSGLSQGTGFSSFQRTLVCAAIRNRKVGWL